MWIFLPGGLLMPAEFPAAKVDRKFVPEGSNFDLQIRARVRSHLENFIRDYATPLGLAHSDIQMTPHMDYNCRIYMNREDFAVAMAAAVLDIDFEKFKPTAERRDADGRLLYKDGKAYHGVLNSLWGTITRLGAPGGLWGSYLGRKPRAGQVGSSFYDYDYGTRQTSRTDDIQRLEDLTDDEWYDRWRDTYDDRTDDVRDSDDLFSDLEVLADEIGEEGETIPSWLSSSERYRQACLETVEGIPASQWPDWLTEDEMRLVHDVYERELKREAKADRQARKRQRGKHRQSTRRPSWAR